MNQKLNRYAVERGQHNPQDDGFRNEDVKVPIPRPPSLPFPGDESVGPTLYEFIRHSRHAIETQNQLLFEALSKGKDRSIVEKQNGTTDANGNLDLLLYTVPQGFELTITRVNNEAGNFTPAAPFSAATAWIALVYGQTFGFGSILDFGPASSGGSIFPSVWTDSDSQAIRLRGGQQVSLHVVGSATLATTAVACRMQGFLREL